MAHAIRHWLKGFELHPAPLLYEVPESAATGIPDSANETQASSFTRERWGEKPNISAEDFISSDDSSHLQHRHHPRHPAFAGQEKDIITEDSPNKHAMASAPFEGDFETGLMPSSSEINLPSNQSPGLQRRLSQFHIQMIAFGGSIGTGLYIGSGSVYASGGPGFLLIDYCLIGSMLYCVVMCLGELAVIFPVSGSFATYSSRFISPTWGFAMGWNYWMQWFTTLPLELVAATIIISFWDPNQTVSPGVWVISCWLVVAIINIFGVRGYGDFEVFGSVLKIIMTLGFIVAGIVTTAGGGPNHHAIGVRYWHNGLAFLNGFKGFCSIFVSAAFSFSGTEMVGVTAAETKNPRRAVPKAVRQVFMRIMLFYIGSLFVITLNISPLNPALTEGGSNDPNTSPFVLTIKQAGIQVLPSIINAVILVSSLSVGNTSVYGASRTLVALAQNGQAPRWFAYVDREGRPMPAVLLSMAMGFLAFLCYSASSGDVFNWLLALSGLAILFSWGSVAICYIRFRQAWKAAGRSADALPWRSPVGLPGAWYALVFNLVVIIFQAIIAIAPIGAENMNVSDRVVTFFQAYLAAPVTLIFLLFGEMNWKSICHDKWGWKCLSLPRFGATGIDQPSRIRIPIMYGPPRFWLGSWVREEDIDLDTGRREGPPLEEVLQEKEAWRQTPRWKKILEFFF